jgi:hypothetical protein
MGRVERNKERSIKRKYRRKLNSKAQQAKAVHCFKNTKKLYMKYINYKYLGFYIKQKARKITQFLFNIQNK